MSEQKIQRFMSDLGNALERLREIMAVPVEENDYVMDATIQRFEFSFELFWKTIRLFLIEGGIEVGSPKRVLVEAYSLGWLTDEARWLSMLHARNLSSHVYNEQKAREIYQLILNNAPMMHSEYASLKERFAELLD